jgi:hypothetical protein
MRTHLITRIRGNRSQIAELSAAAADRMSCPRFRGLTWRCVMRIKNEYLEAECFRGQSQTTKGLPVGDSCQTRRSRRGWT